MPTSVSVPKSWVASVGRLALPKRTQRRMQALMDGNNEGRLTQSERLELATLVEWSEKVSLIRADALEFLGSRPA